MPTILLNVRLEDSGSSTEPAVTLGWQYRVRNSVDYVNGAGELVRAAWPAGGGWKNFTGSAIPLDLDALAPDNPYLLHVRQPGDPTSKDPASRQPQITEEYRQVVSGTANNTPWFNLTRVSGPGPDSTTYPQAGYSQLAAQIADLQNQIDNLTVGGGGASTLAGITDMSANARSFNAGANYAAMRTLLLAAGTTTVDDLAVGDDATITGDLTVSGAVTVPDGSLAIADTSGLQAALDAKAPLASPTFTATLTAANPTFTGTVTIPDAALAIADTSGLQAALDAKAPLASPTFTGAPAAPTASAGTNTTQVATTAFTQAALASVPYPFYAVSGAYPGRPVTSRPVWWMSWDVQPPASSGTTTSGTGPVVGLDVVFLATGVVPG